MILNSLKTTLLLTALMAVFLAVGAALGGRGGMVLAFGLGLAVNLGAWWFSDRIALRMNGAREVAPHEAPDLHGLVAELAARARLPKPRVFVVESDAPNAFATGRSPARGAVAVTTGLVRLLSRDELAGVVAHELAHIRNRDTLVSSVAASFAGAITMLAEMAQWALLFTGFGGQGQDREDSGPGLVGSLAMIVLAPIAALMVQMAISRSREFGADAGGAAILGSPLPLASALRKLEHVASRGLVPETSAATSHLYIVNPLRGGGWSALFRTHPRTEERVRRLLALAPGR